MKGYKSIHMLIEEEVHRKLKIICAFQKLSLQELLTKICDQYAKQFNYDYNKGEGDNK